jgi:hypothetical protein
MDETTVNLKPLQIINPNTGRKIFIGTKIYKDLQKQGLIPKDAAFNPKKLGKAEPMFKVMNKTSSGGGAEPKSAMVKPKSATKSKSKAVVAVESESSSEDDEDALAKILAKSKTKKTKTKRPPTPQPSSESESESESEDSSSSDSSD